MAEVHRALIESEKIVFDELLANGSIPEKALFWKDS